MSVKGIQTWVWMAIFLTILLACCAGSAIENGKMKCQMNCDLQDYKPICATNDKGEIKTFPNLCVLKTENCLRTSTFQKTANGVCP